MQGTIKAPLISGPGALSNDHGVRFVPCERALRGSSVDCNIKGNSDVRGALGTDIRGSLLTKALTYIRIPLYITVHGALPYIGVLRSWRDKRKPPS